MNFNLNLNLNDNVIIQHLDKLNFAKNDYLDSIHNIREYLFTQKPKMTRDSISKIHKILQKTNSARFIFGWRQRQKRVRPISIPPKPA